MKTYTVHGATISVAETTEEVLNIAQYLIKQEREEGAATSANIQALMQFTRQARQVLMDAARLGKPLSQQDYNTIAAFANDGTALAYERQGY